MTRFGPWLPPRSLFGRTALVIAAVSIAFQLFTLAVIFYFALVPLGKHATSDLAALMISSAQAWTQAAPAHRPALESRLANEHALHVRVGGVATEAFVHALPYFHLLEAALSARTGEEIVLEAGPIGETTGYWARLPVHDGRGRTTWLQVGFPDSRIKVHPSAALLIIFLVGAGVILVTAGGLARWLIMPLASLAAAAQRIGKGRRPPALPETGPSELAALAGAFNRMGEEVEALLANRTTLLAGISHDLRSPLARIRLALGMFSENPAPDLLERIERDVENMNLLIARCLEVGRDFVEKDTIELDLCDLLADIAAEQASGVEIRGRRGTSCRLRVKPLALRRILSNLVDNAVRHGGGHPVDIEYEVRGNTVEIRVLDRGPGIPASELEAVFQPFHRLGPSRSSHTGGSGLGLAIARQIALANGWTVALEARPGGGMIARARLSLVNE